MNIITLKIITKLIINALNTAAYKHYINIKKPIKYFKSIILVLLICAQSF